VKGEHIRSNMNMKIGISIVKVSGGKGKSKQSSPFHVHLVSIYTRDIEGEGETSETIAE